MNRKEIGEIRRRIRRDRSNMTAIYGCYVNSQKEIVSEFKQSVAMMSENEAERYFGTMKRVLSGGIGKNLIDISFKTAQVTDSSEHSLLMNLRKSALQDQQSRQEFYQKVIEAVDANDGYVILIGCDSYDVPFKGKDDELHVDASDETYTYLLCAICPVKLTKPSLYYVAEEKEFHDGGVVNVLAMPEFGFLFPAFDNRSTNIYNALYYTRSTKENHPQFVDAVFNVQVPMPAAEQKQSFESLLSTSLGESCSYDVVQNVHDTLRQCVQLHKENHVPEPLLISKDQVKEALEACGVPERNMAKFSVAYDDVFGFEAEVHPDNIINTKRIEINMPDVSIKVNPERADLIETRVIGGVRYIMICADENVEVNGVPIHISQEELTTV